MRTIGLNATLAKAGVLQTHLEQGATTMCWLLKITARDGTILGVTSLDQDVTYDDGLGEVTYKAAIGQDQSALDASADLAVDNSEATMLLTDLSAFTEEKIEAGVLDYARYVIYRVNYKDLDAGHYIPAGGFGHTGICKAHDGLAAVIELRGLSQQTKQNFVSQYSTTCRARFGGPECQFDADSLWQSHTITSVDTEEPDRVFTANAAPAVNGPNGALTFVPGLVEWVTGDNAGKFSEVESVEGAVISLRFGTPYTIQSTDTFKIRPDCDKRISAEWTNGVFSATGSCIDDFDNFSEFRGEPFIPMGDETKNLTEGALTITAYPDIGTGSGNGDDPEPAAGTYQVVDVSFSGFYTISGGKGLFDWSVLTVGTVFTVTGSNKGNDGTYTVFGGNDKAVKATPLYNAIESGATITIRVISYGP